MSSSEAGEHQGRELPPPGDADPSELREVNARLLVAGLQAQEQTDTQVVLNTALRELMEFREAAAQERERLLALEQEARSQLEAFSAENARQRRTFEALLDASADHIFLLDPAGRFAYVNRAAAQIVYWTSPAMAAGSSQIIGRTARELGFAEDFLQQFEANHARAMKGETCIGETHFPSPVTFRMFEYVLSPVPGEDGAIEFVVGVTRDIDDQKRAEAEHEELLRVAQTARAQAEAALRVREEILAITSHELRTPVTYVKNRAQLALRALRRGLLDKEQAEEQLNSIIRSADRLEALIADLLDVSRMRSGGPTISTEEVDVAALVGIAARRSMAGPAARHSILVGVPDQPAMLSVDARRLEQVLDNLLNNAVKYSSPGSEIRVRLRWADEGLVLTILDQGIGLPPGEHERIFEPFGRGSNASQGHQPGLGLGLYICRQIVEAHGGRVWAESPGIGHGTLLSVTLPRQRSADSLSNPTSGPLSG